MLSGFSIVKLSSQTYACLEPYHLKTNLNLLCQKQYSLVNLEFQILTCNRKLRELNVLVNVNTKIIREIFLLIIRVLFCPYIMNVLCIPDPATSKKGYGRAVADAEKSNNDDQRYE